jgi:hypothetical protein
LAATRTALAGTAETTATLTALSRTAGLTIAATRRIILRDQQCRGCADDNRCENKFICLHVCLSFSSADYIASMQ